MRNLCHFDISIGGELYARAKKPVRFEPVLRGETPLRTLMGYTAPEVVDCTDGDRRVVVPRFAAAIAWALSRGLEPLTVPQKHLGNRGQPGSEAPELVLESAEDLEPAPSGLAYEFVSTPFTDVFERENIQRMIGGAFPIIAIGIGTFEPVPAGARDLPDGTAVLPALQAGMRAVLSPNSGPCVRAAKALGVAVLVTGVPHPVTKEVELYRVA